MPWAYGVAFLTRSQCASHNFNCQLNCQIVILSYSENVLERCCVVVGNGKANMGSAKTENVLKSGAKPYGRVLITLKNQLLPEDKLSPTPSQNDGLDPETETDLRIYGCELIQTAGILLKLPQVAMATGQVLLQRFYYSKSLVRHPVDHTAMACVCLASKIEEAPRRVRDVINVFTHIRQVNSNKTIQPVILDQNYIQLKNLVIKAERRVLKELGFCVHIKHPHKSIVMYLQVLGFEKNQKLMQYSWNYMNDSLRTDVFVRYQPETVACACIYLTARKLKLPLPKNPSWYTIFGAKENEIRDISIRILKLYDRPKANIELLEKKVDELCKQYQDARVKARSNSNNSNSNSGINTSNNNEQQQQYQTSPNTTQRTSGAHNAWGGFISRSGSHIAPLPLQHQQQSQQQQQQQQQPQQQRNNSRSPRSISPTSPIAKYNNNININKRSSSTKKQYQRSSRSRTPTSRNYNKKNHKRRSYTRSRSPQNSPMNQQLTKMKKTKRRSSISPITNDNKYIERYEKYDRYDENNSNKKERHDRRDEKYERRSDKKSSKHDKDNGRDRSKDRRR